MRKQQIWIDTGEKVEKRKIKGKKRGRSLGSKDKYTSKYW